MWQGDKPAILFLHCICLASETGPHCVALNLQQSSHLCLLSTGTVTVCHHSRHHKVDFYQVIVLKRWQDFYTQWHVEPSITIQSPHWTTCLPPSFPYCLYTSTSVSYVWMLPACHLGTLFKGVMSVIAVFIFSPGGVNCSPCTGHCNSRPSQRAWGNGP